MSITLLNWFILASKLMVCICIFVAIHSHHWIREHDGKQYGGIFVECNDYGHKCSEMGILSRVSWFFYITILLNVVLESLNILLLSKRTRSRINLLLEELGLLTTIVLLLPSTVLSVTGLVLIRRDAAVAFDWSFFVFLLSLGLALVEFICSLVRVVTYCRDNSFRSSVITYTSNNNDETVHIQT